MFLGFWLLLIVFVIDGLLPLLFGAFAVGNTPVEEELTSPLRLLLNGGLLANPLTFLFNILACDLFLGREVFVGLNVCAPPPARCVIRCHGGGRSDKADDGDWVAL